MRRLFSLLIVTILLAPIIAYPAIAEDAPKADVPKAHHARETWEQHFTQANASHDGHLTVEEAKAGYPLIAKHFDDIDVEHKGYVTQNDIRAWRVMRKAAHRLAQPPEDQLKPRHAFQPHARDSRPAPTARTAFLNGPQVISDATVDRR